jgi:hypothetical protein
MYLLFSKKNITALFIFIISIAAVFDYPGKDNLYLYFIFVIYFSFMTLNVFIKKSLILKVDKIGGSIAILFLLMWILGQFIGHINGNDLIAMMRNFAGMLLFIVYLVMSHSEISKDTIIRLIFYSSVAFMICNLLMIFNHSISLNLAEFFKFDVVRIYYNVAFIPIVAFSSVATISYIFGNQYIANKNHNYFNKKWKSKLFISIALLVLIFYSSKAVYAILFINVFFITLLFAYKYRKLWTIIKLCLFFVIFAVIANYMFAYNILDVIKLELILERHGVRSIQASMILNDMQFFGSGLGGVLLNGYSRDALGYGFELSYLSVMHKYGILSFLIFLPYLYMAIYSIYGVLYMSDKIVYLIALSMTISILIFSYGNPLLFHPLVVFYTLLVLLLLSRKNINFVRSERCVE